MHIANLQRAGSVLGSKVTPQSITQGSLSDACKQSHDSPEWAAGGFPGRFGAWGGFRLIPVVRCRRGVEREETLGGDRAEEATPVVCLGVMKQKGVGTNCHVPLLLQMQPYPCPPRSHQWARHSPSPSRPQPGGGPFSIIKESCLPRCSFFYSLFCDNFVKAAWKGKQVEDQGLL